MTLRLWDDLIGKEEGRVATWDDFACGWVVALRERESEIQPEMKREVTHNGSNTEGVYVSMCICGCEDRKQHLQIGWEG